MAAKFSSKVVGYGAAVKSLKRIPDQGARSHRKAIDAVTKAVFNRSQDYCPVDTESLKNTAYWTGETGEEKYRRGTQTTYVTYIIYPEPYGVFVHECIDHFHEPPTSAKFISRSVDELWSELNRIAGEAYRNAFFTEFSAI